MFRHAEPRLVDLIVGKPAPETLAGSVRALAGLVAFTKLTRDRGWPADRYQGWLLQIAAGVLRSAEP